MLEEKIKSQIELNGPIGIAEFMGQCLYDPQFGYYTNQKPIGAKGDFITAPEISQMFGEMLGLWVVSCFYNLGQPAKFNLIELGPGRGTLMADIVRTIERLGLGGKFAIKLVETNPYLRDLQKQNLLGQVVHWLKDFGDLLAGETPNIIIGNEFLDCFPIRQFVLTEHGWHERLVGLENGALVFGFGPKMANPPFNAPKDAKIGTICEFAPMMESFIAKISDILKANSGYALFIDYGHFGDETGDSFQALYKHEKTSPLKHLGQADLTAHVDFGLVEKIGLNNGLYIEGPSTQADLLKALGIEARAQALIATSTSQTEKISNELTRLIDENQMGALFKAIVLTTLGSDE